MGHAPAEVAREQPFKLGELLGLLLHLRNRVESEWQRVIYIHAALIGVMIFFAGQEPQYLPARLAILVFYTFNIVASYVALSESYGGIAEVTRDLAEHPERTADSRAQKWLASRDYRHGRSVRGAVLVVVWVAVTYLLLSPLVGAAGV